MINSKIIAELAGVSRSTVTRVLNNYPDISSKTREKVLKIIKEHEYYPNISAQKLVGKKSGIIGLLVYTGESSKKRGEYKKITESLYYSELISKIIDAGEELGYLILVSYINRENTSWEKIFANGVIDGALVISGGKRYKEIEKLINSKNKIVLLDYEKKIEGKNVTSINSNNFEGGYKGTEYLIKKGHRDILYITGELKRKSTILRVRGYQKCLKDNQILINKVIPGKFNKESGKEIINNLMRENKEFKYTAILCGNDYIAFGVIEGLKENGLKVPEDISVIGYDNMELCEYTTPKITSINHLDKNIAKKALIKLINILEDKEEEAIETEIEIIERESVKKLSK
jgi:LacI family transcriptional regulator|uniref:LacI family DNA-binding transcriptional regulator n=1 Tax=Fusobacterium mortiferum TaxID=850 RepID=UPI003FEE5B88